MYKKLLPLLFLMCLNAPSYGTELHLLEPRDVYIESYRYENMYDPYLYPVDSELAYGAGFFIDLNIWRYGWYTMYWKNMLHFDQSRESGQIRHGGWEFELGFNIWPGEGPPKIDIFHQHHSRHILEDTRETHFPVYDRAGIRLHIYP